MKIVTRCLFFAMLLGIAASEIFAQQRPKELPPRRPGLLVWGSDSTVIHDTIPGNCGCNIFFGFEPGIHINSWSQTVTGQPSLNNSSLLNAESASGISGKVGIVFDIPLRFAQALGLQFRMSYNWVTATSGGTQVGTYDLKKISNDSTTAGNVTTDYSVQTQVL